MNEKHQIIYEPKGKKSPDDDLRYQLENDYKDIALRISGLFNQNQFKKISEDDNFLDIAFDNPSEENSRALNLAINSARRHYGKFIEFVLVRSGDNLLSLTISDVTTGEKLDSKTINDIAGNRYPDYFKIGRYYSLYNHKILTIFTARAKANAWVFEKI